MYIFSLESTLLIVDMLGLARHSVTQRIVEARSSNHFRKMVRCPPIAKEQVKTRNEAVRLQM